MRQDQSFPAHHKSKKCGSFESLWGGFSENWSKIGPQTAGVRIVHQNFRKDSPNFGEFDLLGWHSLQIHLLFLKQTSLKSYVFGGTVCRGVSSPHQPFLRTLGTFERPENKTTRTLKIYLTNWLSGLQLKVWLVKKNLISRKATFSNCNPSPYVSRPKETWKGEWGTIRAPPACGPILLQFSEKSPHRLLKVSHFFDLSCAGKLWSWRIEWWVKRPNSI